MEKLWLLSSGEKKEEGKEGKMGEGVGGR